jgi:2-oxoglutarate ferredoxin oxidoreductase subunit alpha
LLISYGVTARAAKAVYKALKNSAQPVSLLILKTLWPVPVDVIRRAAEGCKRVVMVEMNLGQYVAEIKRTLADKPVEFYGQMDGRLIPPYKIKEAIIDG